MKIFLNLTPLEDLHSDHNQYHHQYHHNHAATPGKEEQQRDSTTVFQQQRGHRNDTPIHPRLAAMKQDIKVVEDMLNALCEEDLV